MGQIVRMVQEKSSDDQSLTSWALVSLALILWFNFFWRTMPKGSARTYSLVGTGVGILMNAIVMATVLFFRYW